MDNKTILVIGTYDTKNEELEYIAECIRRQGGEILSMDVGVLGNPLRPTDISKHDVARAAGKTIDEIIELGDESSAFRVMSNGAAITVAKLWSEGRFDGVLALGGTMGTDLALDCAQALPLGVPKYIVSTVSFSPIIPTHRLSPDLQMILWAGGLYGLNSICRSSLSQAAGAVLGAARAVEPPDFSKPLIGMTSLGSSCLSYMKHLKPELEERGFEVAIFHSQGMGGMAFERLAAAGLFACVLDLCVQEFVNMLAGSLVSSGKDRLTGAGLSGTPQMIAPGALDLIDFVGRQEIPSQFADRPIREHNRLIKNAVFTGEERAESVRQIKQRLQQANGPVKVFLPLGGVEEWDREGQPAHDPSALLTMIEAMRVAFSADGQLCEVDAHINDKAFSDAVLAQLDTWIAEQVVANPIFD